MNLFNKIITFTRGAPGQDALAGETRPAFAAVGSLTNIPAAIQQEFGGVVDSFSRRGIRITHSVFTKTDVSALQIGDLGTDGNGAVYIVRQPQDMAGRGRVWCVYVEQLP